MDPLQEKNFLACLADHQEAFALFDRNGDELESVLQSMGYHPTRKDLMDMIKEVDTDGNGTIELNEFQDIIFNAITEANAEEELKEAFKLFDKDNNGLISPNELMSVIGNLGKEVQYEEVEAMIKEVDLDGDVHVDFREFSRVMGGWQLNLPSANQASTSSD
ncbi:neo-calmodulin-like isoform X2 [Zingiber officinale]|uniref:neo-calmodulin-like isoform X2 n=1 Tax=Zingiber officinale TaxID=94328 RepID=UPI001C4C5902|nr:neo-calmodulin-like isoform X2 [Zingiber officinale]